MTTIIYSRYDYDNIEERNFDHQSHLCPDTIEMINDLTDQVSAPTYSKTPTFPVNTNTSSPSPLTEKDKKISILNMTHRSADANSNQSHSHSHIHRGKLGGGGGGVHHSYAKANTYRRGTSLSNDNTINKSEEKWRGAKPSFQPTKIQRNKEGMHGIEDSVRLLLNKLTDKTYTKISDQIKDIVVSVKEQELKDILTKQVISVACVNHINSRSYSRLLLEIGDVLGLTGRFMEDHIIKYTESYKELLKESPSPETDYDRFCEVNMLNNIRKGTTQFYCYLTENGLITDTDFKDSTNTLMTLLYDNKDKASSLQMNEELAENLYILCKYVLNNDNLVACEEIKSFIVAYDLSPFLSKKISGVSQKAKFKLMDINDLIKKYK